MQKLLIKLYLITFSFLISATVFSSEPKIEAFKAPFFVGQSVMACGKLVEVKHLGSRHYLNLDKSYPNQTLTILIWNNDYRWFEERFGSIDTKIGHRFCARGVVEEYKNNMQIQIKNPQFLRLMK